MASETFLRLRGLPWSATKADIVEFFAPIPLAGGEEGVEIVMYNTGRPSGEAFVELENSDDYAEAEKKHNQHIGSRYVEVFPVQENELPKKRSNPNREGDDCIMRLRGLPFTCSKDDIFDFFEGYDIVSNGIVLPSDHQGRPTGDAYVQFIDKDTAERSLEKHKAKMGHRYIEIFKSSEMEMRNANFREPRFGPMGGGFSNRPSPYDSRDRFGGANRYGGRGGGAPRGYDTYGDGGFGGGNGYGDGWGGRRAGGYDRGGRGGGMGRSMGGGGGMHNVHMRGIPFRATFEDICDFFAPVVPVHVAFSEDNTGRPSGEADVEFSTHEDAVSAMSKDKMNMQHRYIELFLNSSPIGGPPGGGPMGGAGGYGRRY